MNEKIELSVYAVRNQDGKWFRSKGFGGYGSCWVDDILKAKIYPKIGGARGRVTWWANHFPQYGVPELVELQITNAIVTDESERVKKTQEKEEKRKANYDVRIRKRAKADAQRLLVEAQSRLDRLS